MSEKKDIHRYRVLFRYEMKYMRIFYIIGLLASVALVLCVFSDLHGILSPVRGVGIYSYSQAGDMASGSVFGYVLTQMLRDAVCVCVPLLAVMAMVQFSDLQRRGSREYLSSLPFTQNEKFFMKVIVSYGMITVCCLVIAVGTIITRIYYQPLIIKNNVLSPMFHQLLGADTIWHTLRSLLLFWLTLLAMYSVYMVIAHLIRNSIFSAVVGVGALFWPLGLVTVGWWSFHNMDVEQSTQLYKILAFLTKVKRYVGMFAGRALGYRSGSYMTTGMFRDMEDYTPKGAEQMPYNTAALSYGNMWISFGIALALIIGCTCLARWVNKKQDLAKINGRIPTAVGRVGMNIGFSTSLGAIITYFWQEGLLIGVSSTVSWYRFVVLWLVISVFIFIIGHLTKVWKRV